MGCAGAADWEIALLLSACAATHFQAPDVTPTAVELQDVQINQQRFKVALHVQNPNDRALPIKWAKCALEIEGVEVGRCETSVGTCNVRFFLKSAKSSPCFFSSGVSIAEAVVRNRHHGDGFSAHGVERAQLREQIGRRLDEIASRRQVEHGRGLIGAGSEPRPEGQ